MTTSMTSGAAIPRNSIFGEASTRLLDIRKDKIVSNLRILADLIVVVKFFILNFQSYGVILMIYSGLNETA